MGFKQTEMIKKKIATLDSAINAFVNREYIEVRYLRQFKLDLEKILKADDKIESREDVMRIKLTKFVFEDAYECAMNYGSEEEIAFLQGLPAEELKKFAEKHAKSFGQAILNMDWYIAFDIIMTDAIEKELKK